MGMSQSYGEIPGTKPRTYLAGGDQGSMFFKQKIEPPDF